MNRMQEEVKGSTERAYYSQMASDQVYQKNNIHVMPSFGLQPNLENDIGPYEQNLNFQRFEQIKDFRGHYQMRQSMPLDNLDEVCDMTQSFAAESSSRNIINSTMRSHELRPFQFRNGRRPLDSGRVIQVQTRYAQPQQLYHGEQ